MEFMEKTRVLEDKIIFYVKYNKRKDKILLEYKNGKI